MNRPPSRPDSSDNGRPARRFGAVSGRQPRILPPGQPRGLSSGTKRLGPGTVRIRRSFDEEGIRKQLTSSAKCRGTLKHLKNKEQSLVEQLASSSADKQASLQNELEGTRLLIEFVKGLLTQRLAEEATKPAPKSRPTSRTTSQARPRPTSGSPKRASAITSRRPQRKPQQPTPPRATRRITREEGAQVNEQIRQVLTDVAIKGIVMASQIDFARRALLDGKIIKPASKMDHLLQRLREISEETGKRTRRSGFQVPVINNLAEVIFSALTRQNVPRKKLESAFRGANKDLEEVEKKDPNWVETIRKKILEHDRRRALMLFSLAADFETNTLLALSERITQIRKKVRSANTPSGSTARPTRAVQPQYQVAAKDAEHAESIMGTLEGQVQESEAEKKALRAQRDAERQAREAEKKAQEAQKAAQEAQAQAAQADARAQQAEAEQKAATTRVTRRLEQRHRGQYLQMARTLLERTVRLIAMVQELAQDVPAFADDAAEMIGEAEQAAERIRGLIQSLEKSDVLDAQISVQLQEMTDAVSKAFGKLDALRQRPAPEKLPKKDIQEFYRRSIAVIRAAMGRYDLLADQYQTLCQDLARRQGGSLAQRFRTLYENLWQNASALKEVLAACQSDALPAQEAAFDVLHQSADRHVSTLELASGHLQQAGTQAAQLEQALHALLQETHQELENSRRITEQQRLRIAELSASNRREAQAALTETQTILSAQLAALMEEERQAAGSDDSSATAPLTDPGADTEALDLSEEDEQQAQEKAARARERHRLRSELDRVTGALERLQEEAPPGENPVDGFEALQSSAREALKGREERLTRRVEQLRSDQERFDELRKTLEQEKADLEQARATLDQDQEAFRQQQERAAEQAAAAAHSEALASESGRLQAHLDDLQRELGQLRSERDQLEQSNEATRAEGAELRDQRSAVEQALKGLEDRRDAAEQALRDLEGQRDAAEQALRDREGQRDAAEEALREAENRLERAAQEARDAEARSVELQRSQAEIQLIVDQLGPQKATLEADLEELADKVKCAESDAQEARMAAEKAQEEMTQAENALAHKQAELTQAEQDLTQVQAQRSDQARQLESLQSQQAEARTSLERQQAELESFQQQLRTFSEAVQRTLLKGHELLQHPEAWLAKRKEVFDRLFLLRFGKPGQNVRYEPPTPGRRDHGQWFDDQDKPVEPGLRCRSLELAWNQSRQKAVQEDSIPLWEGWQKRFQSLAFSDHLPNIEHQIMGCTSFVERQGVIMEEQRKAFERVQTEVHDLQRELAAMDAQLAQLQQLRVDAPSNPALAVMAQAMNQLLQILPAITAQVLQQNQHFSEQLSREMRDATALRNDIGIQRMAASAADVNAKMWEVEATEHLRSAQQWENKHRTVMRVPGVEALVRTHKARQTGTFLAASSSGIFTAADLEKEEALEAGHVRATEEEIAGIMDGWGEDDEV